MELRVSDTANHKLQSRCLQAWCSLAARNAQRRLLADVRFCNIQQQRVAMVWRRWRLLVLGRASRRALVMQALQQWRHAAHVSRLVTGEGSTAMALKYVQRRLHGRWALRAWRRGLFCQRRSRAQHVAGMLLAAAHHRQSICQRAWRHWRCLWLLQRYAGPCLARLEHAVMQRRGRELMRTWRHSVRCMDTFVRLRQLRATRVVIATMRAGVRRKHASRVLQAATRAEDGMHRRTAWRTWRAFTLTARACNWHVIHTLRAAWAAWRRHVATAKASHTIVHVVTIGLMRLAVGRWRCYTLAAAQLARAHDHWVATAQRKLLQRTWPRFVQQRRQDRARAQRASEHAVAWHCRRAVRALHENMSRRRQRRGQTTTARQHFHRNLLCAVVHTWWQHAHDARLHRLLQQWQVQRQNIQRTRVLQAWQHAAQAAAARRVQHVAATEHYLSSLQAAVLLRWKQAAQAQQRVRDSYRRAHELWRSNLLKRAFAALHLHSNTQRAARPLLHRYARCKLQCALQSWVSFAAAAAAAEAVACAVRQRLMRSTWSAWVVCVQAVRHTKVLRKTADEFRWRQATRLALRRWRQRAQRGAWLAQQESCIRRKRQRRVVGACWVQWQQFAREHRRCQLRLHAAEAWHTAKCLRGAVHKWVQFCRLRVDLRNVSSCAWRRVW